MNILLLGSGGREHAIAFKLAQSPRCAHLFIAPGNAGTADCGTNVALNPMDFAAVADFVKTNDIAMLVVGPEAPLVGGIADYFAERPDVRHVMVIGPKREGAQLEGSKDFAKAFMMRQQIPTACYQTFTRDTLDAGKAFLRTLTPPYVLKADGLAAGKGVLILPTLEEAEKELQAMLNDAKFGEASSRVVIEEFLSGIEVSLFVFTDGEHYVILPAAKDYKRVGEGDTGLNTGGMGSVSPVPFADPAFIHRAEERIVLPTVRGLKNEKIDYCGFLFIGLMNCNGDPYVIEYNVRMGDPETESVFPRIQNDIVDLFEAAAQGHLDSCTLQVDPRTAACVMMVAEGYPEHYEKGREITIDPSCDDDVLVFHCGTRHNEQGDLVTNGGRVICTTAFADTLPAALEKSYNRARSIQWEGKYMRRDIGQDLL